MKKIGTCLWFNGDAEKAAKLYTSTFKGSKIGKVSRYGEAGPGPKGSVMTIEFTLGNRKFMGLNGGPNYKFSPAISFVVNCKDQKEVDYYWSKLVKGGKPVQCGWLVDPFGVSWQIVPDILPKLLSGKDKAKSARVMQAMFKMVKLDIKALKAAGADKKNSKARGAK